MLYSDLVLPTKHSRPFFYSNFVTTLDGKVTAGDPSYWPIGSENDYQTLIRLRSLADVLIHGSKTAMSHRAVDLIAKDEFKRQRLKIGKKAELAYCVITNHPSSDMVSGLQHPEVKPLLITSKTAHVPEDLSQCCEVLRLGDTEVDLLQLSDYLLKHGFKHALMEGGPHLFTSFLAANLIDELFLTVSPKIFGANEQTLTMVEGQLFKPEEIKKFNLLSVKHLGDEVFLRYAIKE